MIFQFVIIPPVLIPMESIVMWQRKFLRYCLVGVILKTSSFHYNKEEIYYYYYLISKTSITRFI